MSFERKTAANNNGYPSTAYNGSKASDVNAKGLELGSTGGKDTYELVYYIDFADADAQPKTSADDKQIATIPAGAAIKSASVQVLSTISGGTNFALGLSQPSGTVIDADGILAASTATAAGTYIEGAGALVGATIGANPGQLTLTSTRTAGKIKVLVEYVRLDS